MNRKEIVRGNSKVKVKVVCDDYGVSLLTTRNWYRWTTQTISPDVSMMMIDVLQEYLDGAGRCGDFSPQRSDRSEDHRTEEI